MKLLRIPSKLLFPLILAASMIAGALPVPVVHAETTDTDATRRVFLPIVASAQATNAPVPQPPASGDPQPVGVGGSWTLKFADEFNGSSLDLNKWEPNWLAGSNTTITKPVNGDGAVLLRPGAGRRHGRRAQADRRSPLLPGHQRHHLPLRLGDGHQQQPLHLHLRLHGSPRLAGWLLDGQELAGRLGGWHRHLAHHRRDRRHGRAWAAPAWHYHWGSSGSPQQTGGTPAMSTQHRLAHLWGRLGAGRDQVLLRREVRRPGHQRGGQLADVPDPQPGRSRRAFRRRSRCLPASWSTTSASGSTKRRTAFAEISHLERTGLQEQAGCEKHPLPGGLRYCNYSESGYHKRTNTICFTQIK